MESLIGSNWKFRHAAVVVKDMDETLKYFNYLKLGVARPETILDSSAFSQYSVYGKPAKSVHRSRFVHAEIGQDKFDLELISPVEGEPIYVDFLKNSGEGYHHIAFTVENLDAEIAKLSAKGIPVITRVMRPNGRGFAYFDLSRLGKIIIELVQVPPQT